MKHGHRICRQQLLRTLILSYVILCAVCVCACAQGGTFAPIGNLPGGYVKDIAVSGTHAYLAANTNTNSSYHFLIVVDVSDPTAPVTLGRLDTVNYAAAVAVVGDYAYIANSSSGLLVADVSDPTTPVTVSHWDDSASLGEIAAAAGYAYGIDTNYGLRAIDVSDPANPVEAGLYNASSIEKCVAVSGAYAYVGDNYGVLRVVDISNPSAPSLAGYLKTTGIWAACIAVADGYAYVRSGMGLDIISVADPTKPTLVGRWCDTHSITAVAAANGYCYVTAGGLHVLDVTDPSAPVEVGFWDATTDAHAVAVSDGYVYVGYDTGLLVFREAAFSATRICGQVLENGTTGLAGATVEAFQGGELKAWARSGSDGTYAIADLAPGDYDVVARKYGYVTQTTTGVTVATGETTYANFSLTSSGRIQGQVRERSTTTNLPNVTVVAYLNGQARATTTTDALGIYLMDDDLPAGQYVVVADKVGYLTQTKANIGVLSNATTYVNFALAPDIWLMGQVRDGVTGAPLVGVYVSVWNGNTHVATVLTRSPYGLYWLTPAELAPGTYSVWASAPGYLPQSKWQVTVSDGAIVYRNFSLQTGQVPALKGQVKDRNTGTPIIGAVVTIYRNDVPRGTAMTTAPWGTYEIVADLPAGAYVVRASRDEYATQTKSGISIVPGLTTCVNCSLQPLE